jgi:hypothetical protein
VARASQALRGRSDGCAFSNVYFIFTIRQENFIVCSLINIKWK